jgi:hypothetical protein
MGQITTLKFFTLGWKVEDCGLAHFFEELTKVKKLLRSSHLISKAIFLKVFIWTKKKRFFFLYFCPSFKKPLISARKKNKSTKRLIWCYLSYIFLIRPLLEDRAEIQKYFCCFLVQMKNLVFAFEINWPLPDLLATYGRNCDQGDAWKSYAGRYIYAQN